MQIFGRRRSRGTHRSMVRGRKNPLYFGLALRLRQARRQSGLKRLPLAEKAGLAAATERDIETGQRLPTVGTIASLASALSVSAGWLAYGLGDVQAATRAATTVGMGARLQAVRLHQGHTKAALARLVGLSPTALANIEKGAQSGVEVIEALAHTLGISPTWLAFNQEPQVVLSRRRGRPSAPSTTHAG